MPTVMPLLMQRHRRHDSRNEIEMKRNFLPALSKIDNFAQKFLFTYTQHTHTLL